MKKKTKQSKRNKTNPKNEVYQCPCGGHYIPKNEKRHMKTNKHVTYRKLRWRGWFLRGRYGPIPY
jgi:predicted SprT family Zn-dependent metalloprotease